MAYEPPAAAFTKRPLVAAPTPAPRTRLRGSRIGLAFAAMTAFLIALAMQGGEAQAAERIAAAHVAR